MPKSITQRQQHCGDRIPLASSEERESLTKMAMQLFDQWQLKTKDQLNLLGLNETSRYVLSRYRKQETIIPFERDKLDRVGLLLVIYENLHALFLTNKVLRHSWIHRKNKMLDDKTPLEIMTNEGVLGVAKIARFLELQC